MKLKRSLSLPLLMFYGLGTIIGAGIYALIGTVAQEANEYTPFAFLLAALIALFTATSYAELSSRFPESAGSALYIKKAFAQTWLSGLVGWLVVLTGLVSSATLAHGFFNYLQLYLPVSIYVAVPVIILMLGSIAILGIKESATTIMVMTTLEIAGLLLIVWYGKEGFSKFLWQSHDYIPQLNIESWKGIFAGAFIAFYAFIGFEDMVNVAEETKNPEKTLPLAILLALLAATFLYVLVAIVTVTTLPYKELTKSNIPLALIIQHQGHSPLLFNIIALIAILNGILVQIIMASRLIYGMARHKAAPMFFYVLYGRTQTPVLATLVVMVAIVILALWFPIETLARATSTIMLCVFSLINLSLIVIKLKSTTVQKSFTLPIIFPIVGMTLSTLFLILQALT